MTPGPSTIQIPTYPIRIGRGKSAIDLSPRAPRPSGGYGYGSYGYGTNK